MEHWQQQAYAWLLVCGLLLGSSCRAAGDCTLQGCTGGAVCGADGLTYQNRCFADCADVAIADLTGPCKGGSLAHSRLAVMVDQLAKSAASQINLASASGADVAAGQHQLFQEPLTDSDVFRFSQLGLKLVGRQPAVPDASFEAMEGLPVRNITAPTGTTQENTTNSTADGSGYFFIQRLTEQGAVYAAIIPVDKLQTTQTQQTSSSLGRKLRNIIGTDDLISTVKPYQPPYRYVGQINFKGKDNDVGWCTGGLISTTTVITAGHCVYHLPDIDDPESYMYPIMYYFPGRRYLYAQNKTSNPYGVFKIAQKSVLKFYSNSAYMAADENSIVWDVGLLELETPILFGFFDMGVYDVTACHKLTVVGYPGHKHARWHGSQWHTSCSSCPTNMVTTSSLIAVDCDWSPGISGAPLFVKEGKRWQIIGIATGEYMSGSNYFPLNIGTTITHSILQGVKTYMSTRSN